MRRRIPVKADAVVPEEILEQAKRALSIDRLPKKAEKCIVCGAETAASTAEPLCWVCRRLKVSAWRDIEQQVPVQE